MSWLRYMGYMRRHAGRCCLRRRGSELRVDQGGGGRGGGGDLVVVENDDVHAALAERGDGGDGGGAAVHGEQQGGGEFRQAILHAFLAEAVAFIHAMGQVVVDLPAEGAEDFEQQGGGGDAVHVVIAEDDERFVALAGLEQALDGGGHVRQQERVGQLLEPGLEEGGDGGRFAQAAVQQALGEQRRDVAGCSANCAARRGWGGASDQRNFIGPALRCLRRPATTERTMEIRMMPATTSRETEMGIST